MKKILILIFSLVAFTATAQNSFNYFYEKEWTASGTDTYTVTVSNLTALSKDVVIKVKFTNANTGAATLNVNSLGAKAIQKQGGSALTSGDISANQILELSYDGTAFYILGGGGGSSGLTVGTTTVSSGTNGYVLYNNSGVLGNTNTPTLTGTNITGLPLSTGVTGDLPFSNLTQGSALSVLGVSGNATADVASIAAGSDYNILRRSGTAIGFGSIDLSQSGAVGSSILPAGNGGTGLSSLGSGVATWLGTPSWTNFNSAITGTAPYWSLASGGTLTGTNTITASTNPIIFSTGVTTGTDATSGIDVQANSLTTGYGMNIRSSSVTSGRILRINSTSTAIDHTPGTNGLFTVSSSGANGTASKTAIAIDARVTNTGTTSTNYAGYFAASGASTNRAIYASGGIEVDGTSSITFSTASTINLPTSTASAMIITDGTTTFSTYKSTATKSVTYSTPLITSGRLLKTQGADVASAAGAITLGNDGNVFEITGTNAITLISSTDWQNGAIITLLFTSTASLTDGTANSGANIGMELAGNANFSATADDTITLVLSEIGGTQRWREVSRSVN